MWVLIYVGWMEWRSGVEWRNFVLRLELGWTLLDLSTQEAGKTADKRSSSLHRIGEG